MDRLEPHEAIAAVESGELLADDVRYLRHDSMRAVGSLVPGFEMTVTPMGLLWRPRPRVEVA